MVLKLFRVVWFLSVLVVTAALLYAYASLPEQVIIREGEMHSLEISRDMFFYMILGLISVMNVLVMIMAKAEKRNPDFQTWFYGLIITFNIFFIIGISFIALYNGGESYTYKRLETIIYTSIGLFSFWTVAWPIYWGYKRFFSKT